MHSLDHIVFGSFTLDEGTKFVENILQAKLSDIGYHKDMGTHNRVIRISEMVYLEVIAIDPKTTKLKNRKWFNLDNSKLQSKLKNHFELISFEIKLSKTQQYLNSFFKSFGEIEHVSVTITTEEEPSIFNLKLKDISGDVVISLYDIIINVIA